MSSLVIELNVEESLHNAVLWYETDNPGQGREAGKVITKTRFIHCKTTPPLQTFFYKKDGLVEFLKKNLDENTARACLYSAEGFQARTAIKHEVESKIEKRSLWLCCCTCGLILCRFCCCCPGRNWEKDVDKVRPCASRWKNEFDLQLSLVYDSQTLLRLRNYCTKLNEDYFCSQIQERYPDKVPDVTYAFETS